MKGSNKGDALMEQLSTQTTKKKPHIPPSMGHHHISHLSITSSIIIFLLTSLGHSLGGIHECPINQGCVMVKLGTSMVRLHVDFERNISGIILHRSEAEHKRLSESYKDGEDWLFGRQVNIEFAPEGDECEGVWGLGAGAGFWGHFGALSLSGATFHVGRAGPVGGRLIDQTVKWDLTEAHLVAPQRPGVPLEIPELNLTLGRGHYQQGLEWVFGRQLQRHLIISWEHHHGELQTRIYGLPCHQWRSEGAPILRLISLIILIEVGGRFGARKPASPMLASLTLLWVGMTVLELDLPCTLMPILWDPWLAQVWTAVIFIYAGFLLLAALLPWAWDPNVNCLCLILWLAAIPIMHDWIEYVTWIIASVVWLWLALRECAHAKGVPLALSLFNYAWVTAILWGITFPLGGRATSGVITALLIITGTILIPVVLGLLLQVHETGPGPQPEKEAKEVKGGNAEMGLGDNGWLFTAMTRTSPHSHPAVTDESSTMALMRALASQSTWK